MIEVPHRRPMLKPECDALHTKREKIPLPDILLTDPYLLRTYTFRYLIDTLLLTTMGVSIAWILKVGFEQDGLSKNELYPLWAIIATLVLLGPKFIQDLKNYDQLQIELGLTKEKDSSGKI